MRYDDMAHHICFEHRKARSNSNARLKRVFTDEQNLRWTVTDHFHEVLGLVPGDYTVV